MNQRNLLPRNFSAFLYLTFGIMMSCGDNGGLASSEEEKNQESYAGEFYADFLQADPYSKLVIEIDYIDGAEPPDSAVDELVETIQLLCNKPDGIEIQLAETSIPSISDDVNPEYSLEQINELELDNRDHYRGDNTAVLYFLYVDGHSDYDTDDTAVVGYAYHGSSMAIFMGTVNNYLIQTVREDLVKTVTVHEFGHLIGLVDNGAEMVENHLDPDDHGAHCDNPDCMMYWLNNYSSVADVLDGEIPQFDEECLADIANAGGKDAR